MEQFEQLEPGTSGLSVEQAEFIFHRLLGAVLECCHADRKERHFFLMVMTRDKVDHDRMEENVTTDICSTMALEEVQIAMRDWLHMKTQ